MADVGIYIPQVSVGFDALLERARRCDALGIGSFWIYDHLYTPGLPDADALEGWTTATALLCGTARLRVGQLVLNNNFRHPALLAKMVTTLDVISGGRVELGIGSGSYALEHDEGGFPFGSMATRTERLGEALEIITRMFAAERTTFEGTHYAVRDVPNLPRPVQQPRPPIHIGGSGERTLPLVARHADVWNVPTYGLVHRRERSAQLSDLCASIGRDPGGIRRSLEAVLVLGSSAGEVDGLLAKAGRRYAGPGWGLDEGGFIGTPEMVAERMRACIADGFDGFVFFPSDRGEGDMIELLATAVLPALC